MKLAELERRLVHGIDPLADERVTGDIGWVVPAGTLQPAEALDVYRNNITSVRVRALESIFPVCESILGEACFQALARDFCWRTSGAAADLNHYGKDFPDFLAEQDRDVFSELPYLKDLARLEWLWHAAYYAADREPFPFEKFAAMAEEPCRVVFRLADGLGVFRTCYPVRQIWQRHRAGDPVDEVSGLDAAECLCISRSEETREVTLVDQDTLGLLDAIRNGANLEGLSKIAAITDALPQLIPAMIERGWICGFRVLESSATD